ncbi:hypothetical protein LCGC14_2864870 [marine sediment metagenome]|uniref:DUF2493 domain-containing protein n=1 Tax=marine sediment metagenome TaxID=412755 RepID=A0A0F8Y4H4_9ZZZZ
MILGFTGTRDGMSRKQFGAITALLRETMPSEVHHGGCKGADSGFHVLARRLGIRIILHPSVITKHQVVFTADEVRPAEPYLVRNHNIVDEVEGLIACPAEKQEVLRSGTWATIRYARNKGVPVNVIFP